MTFMRNDYVNDLRKYVDNLINDNESLRERLNKWNRDEEIQKLHDENMNIISRSVHIMSDKEVADVKAFSQRHYDSCRGNVEYIIKSSGIGSCILVKCSKCKFETDVTDTSSW